MAVMVIDSQMAGPLAVAISGLLRWYDGPREVRADLLQLQVDLQKAANGGQRSPLFDPDAIAAQAGGMKRLAVPFEDAGKMLSVSDRKARRLAKDGELRTIGEGSGTRVVVASIEAYVARSASDGDAA